MLSTSPAPNPIYQDQNVPLPQEQQEAGWPRRNGVALPVQVAPPIYPQLHHGHNGTEPHFQVRHNTKIATSKEIIIL